MRQEGLWTPTAALPVGASHPFYQRLNQILDEKKFDEYVEAICERFYAEEVGRPGLAPGIYFRLLMVGYFEGIDSERGIAWRASDSLSIRSFVRIALDESVPDHSTISRTRRLMDVETHQAVFQWVLAVLAEKKLLKGHDDRDGRDDAGSQRGAAIIVRRDTGERYEEFLTRLAKESGIETPTREQLAKLDRKRTKKGSNDDWTHPHDPDARITKMKDGRTHLAHKAEHAVDMETGAIVARHAARGRRGRHARRFRRRWPKQASASRPWWRKPTTTKWCKRGQRGRAARGGHRQGLSQPRGGAANWPSGACAPIVRSRIADGSGGRTNSGNNKRCMRIGDAFAENEAAGCCGNAARSWNDGTNICMIAAGCGGCICAAGKTFSSGWWFTPVRRILGC